MSNSAHLDTLINSQLFRISPITRNSTSSISALVGLAVAIAAATAITSGCYWDERPVRDAGNNPAGVNGNSNPSADNSSLNARNPNIPEGTPSFQFGKIDYVLISKTDVVNQYIPFGQTLENWTSMFALRKFPNMSSPEDAVKNVTENLQLNHPETMFKVTRDEETGDRGVDFLIWTDDKQLSEFDVHIYQQRQGFVMGKMFLMRGYGEDGHVELLKTIADTKDSLTKSVFGFSFPVFITPRKE